MTSAGVEMGLIVAVLKTCRPWYLLSNLFALLLYMTHEQACEGAIRAARCDSTSGNTCTGTKDIICSPERSYDSHFKYERHSATECPPSPRDLAVTSYCTQTPEADDTSTAMANISWSMHLTEGTSRRARLKGFFVILYWFEGLTPIKWYLPVDGFTAASSENKVAFHMCIFGLKTRAKMQITVMRLPYHKGTQRNIISHIFNSSNCQNESLHGITQSTTTLRSTNRGRTASTTVQPTEGPMLPGTDTIRTTEQDTKSSETGVPSDDRMMSRELERTSDYKMVLLTGAGVGVLLIILSIAICKLSKRGVCTRSEGSDISSDNSSELSVDTKSLSPSDSVSQVALNNRSSLVTSVLGTNLIRASLTDYPDRSYTPVYQYDQMPTFATQYTPKCFMDRNAHVSLNNYNHPLPHNTSCPNHKWSAHPYGHPGPSSAPHFHSRLSHTVSMPTTPDGHLVGRNSMCERPRMMSFIPPAPITESEVDNCSAMVEWLNSENPQLSAG